MQCQHLPEVGGSREERIISKKRMEQGLLSALHVSCSPSPVQAAGAGQDKG